MSERTTNTLLGAFVMGGIIVAAALILSMAGSGLGRNTQQVRMVFDGSVTGLNVGAPVALRGVEIGQVTDIRVRLADASGINLVMEVDAELDAGRIQQDLVAIEGISQTLIDAGLRAQLDAQSLLTGLLYVQLDFHPDTAVTLRCLTSERFEIPTIPSPFEQLIEQIDGLHLPALAANLEAVMRSVREVTEDPAFKALPGRTLAVLDTAEATLTALDYNVGTLGTELSQTLAETRTAIGNISSSTPTILALLETNLNQLQTTLASIEATSNQAGSVMEHDSPLLLSLTSVLREIERTSRSLNALARTLEEQPQSLLLGKPATEDSSP